MDPLTHTLLGAAAGGALFGHRLGRHAVLLGAAGGLLPDIDVIIPTLAPWAGDPALPWLHHRHFTHALFAVPFVGAVAAMPWLAFSRFRTRALLVVGAATAGAATHGLNDTLTSFGTHLWWPFTNARTAWDLLPIIDPLVTLPLLLGVLLSLMTAGSDRTPRRWGGWPALTAVAIFLGHVGFAAVQRNRAMDAQSTLVAERGHAPIRRRVTPTLGNTVVWRAFYDQDGTMYADAIRVVPFRPTSVRRGASHPLLDTASLPIDESGDPRRVAWVLSEFNTFADGWVGLVAPAHDALTGMGAALLGDLRYSLDAAGMVPLWGLRVDPLDPIDPVVWSGIGQPSGIEDGATAPQTRGDALRALWRDIVDPDGSWAPVTR